MIALVVAATSACGDDDDRVESSAESPLTSIDSSVDGDLPCEELRVVAEAQPPTGNLEPDEFEAAYDRYAEAAERAAGASGGTQRELLTDFAELMRTIGSDPATDVVDEVERLADPMEELTSEAREECDVSFGLLPR